MTSDDDKSPEWGHWPKYFELDFNDRARTEAIQSLLQLTNVSNELASEMLYGRTTNWAEIHKRLIKWINRTVDDVGITPEDQARVKAEWDT
jgi:hypothetical protein